MDYVLHVAKLFHIIHPHTSEILLCPCFMFYFTPAAVIYVLSTIAAPASPKAFYDERESKRRRGWAPVISLVSSVFLFCLDYEF